MTRPIPQIAVDFVAEHEGLRLKAYQDSVGIWTIGYGHIDGVKPGQVINTATAKAFLRQDMQIAVRKLYSVVKAERIEALSVYEYAALLSFTYNLGAKASWTIWKHVNAGRDDLVPAEIMRFTRAGGKVIKGLVRRRADEVKLWSTVGRGEPPHEHEPPPSAVTRQPGMTPPVTAEKPLAKQKTFVAQCLTGTSVALAGVSSYAEPTQQAAAKLALFTGAPIIENMHTAILTVAGVFAFAGIVSAVLHHMANKQ